MHKSTVEEFLNEFLLPPKGNTPDDIKARFEHWINVANNPQLFVNESNPFESAHRRRMARQNLRRLCKKYPAIAEQIRRERASTATKEVA